MSLDRITVIGNVGRLSHESKYPKEGQFMPHPLGATIYQLFLSGAFSIQILLPILINSITMLSTIFRSAKTATTPLSRGFATSMTRLVAVGDAIPKVNVYEDSPGNVVDIAEATKEGKSVIIGIPGAFSPACSASHVPGFLKNLRGFNEKGYEKFFVVAVNDPFVTSAFKKELLENTVGSNQLKFLADSQGEFSKQLDVLFDATKIFGNPRSARYALLVDNGKVIKTFIEPDNTSIDVSDAAKVLAEA